MAVKKKKTKAQLLQERLSFKIKSAWEVGKKEDIESFSKKYTEFFSKCKTEREVAEFIIEEVKKKGFREIGSLKSYKPGEKVYEIYNKKTVFLAVLGRKKPSEGLKLTLSHLDAPRIDLKPSPIYEDEKLCLFKTHYYGGIKKYQWVNVPLELHGIIFKQNGEKLEIKLGSKKDEPVFVITDLLPHLGKKQMEKQAKEVVSGEELNVLIGNIPVKDEEIEEKVKLAILKILEENYGIKEEDFISAELELIPSLEPREIGFDKSMIGAYGQDNRSHVFITLSALLESRPTFTSVACFFDKEEIGSETNTGAQSNLFENFISKLLDLEDGKSGHGILYETFEKSEALSTDVTGALNPNYKDVYDITNSSRLGYGVCLSKYTGYGGKSDSNDAHAEFINKIRMLLNKNRIPWQTGELGKVDEGGGGTIGKFLARRGMNVLDFGICLLGMHSPYEISSKADIFHTFRACKAFFEMKN